MHEAEAIAPGFDSPTVNSLEDEAWCAVRVMVPRKEIIAKMEQLANTKSQVIAKAQMAADLLERVPRSYLLASITNALPKGASLTQLELKTEKPAAATPKAVFT